MGIPKYIVFIFSTSESLWQCLHIRSTFVISRKLFQPVSIGSIFTAIKKPRTFTAIEIRHKNMRKMQK